MTGSRPARAAARRRPGVTFVARRDTLYGVSATLGWRPAEAFFVSASASYDKQDSRLFLADFDAFETAIMLTARYRF